jgi:hypothetical protein
LEGGARCLLFKVTVKDDDWAGTLVALTLNSFFLSSVTTTTENKTKKKFIRERKEDGRVFFWAENEQSV